MNFISRLFPTSPGVTHDDIDVAALNASIFDLQQQIIEAAEMGPPDLRWKEVRFPCPVCNAELGADRHSESAWFKCEPCVLYLNPQGSFAWHDLGNLTASDGRKLEEVRLFDTSIEYSTPHTCNCAHCYTGHDDHLIPLDSPLPVNITPAEVVKLIELTEFYS